MLNPSIYVLYSELVLSLYPLLIKTIHTNTYTQVLSRFLVFPILATIFGTNTFKTLSTSILPNILNIVHVFVSYIAFKILPIGTAISLFYLYPFFNVIAGHFIFGEYISFLSIILIGVSFIGVYLIATSQEKEKEKEKEKESKFTFGVLMALFAAITETMIYVFVRSDKNAIASPFYAVNHLYPLGLILLGLYGVFNTSIIDVSLNNWIKLIGFNALLGFTGYIARFYSIPKIPTIIFALLSFFGVSFGYLWGNLFTTDIPTNKAIIGSICIAGSISLLRYFE